MTEQIHFKNEHRKWHEKREYIFRKTVLGDVVQREVGKKGKGGDTISGLDTACDHSPVFPRCERFQWQYGPEH